MVGQGAGGGCLNTRLPLELCFSRSIPYCLDVNGFQGSQTDRMPRCPGCIHSALPFHTVPMLASFVHLFCWLSPCTLHSFSIPASWSPARLSCLLGLFLTSQHDQSTGLPSANTDIGAASEGGVWALQPQPQTTPLHPELKGRLIWMCSWRSQVGGLSGEGPGTTWSIPLSVPGEEAVWKGPHQGMSFPCGLISFQFSLFNFNIWSSFSGCAPVGPRLLLLRAKE